MPNWCENVLEITGPRADADKLRAMMTTAIQAFDFEAVLPVPASLHRIDDSTAAETAWELKYGDWSKVSGKYGPKYFRTRNAAIVAAQAADDWRPCECTTRDDRVAIMRARSFHELADIVHACVIQHGHKSFGAWASETWGTVCNALESRWRKRKNSLGSEHTAYFDTKWSPPIPVIAALSVRFPNLTLRLTYGGLDVDFRGFVTFCNGNVLASKHEERS